jgi:hypothetical protein
LKLRYEDAPIRISYPARCGGRSIVLHLLSDKANSLHFNEGSLQQSWRGIGL